MSAQTVAVESPGNKLGPAFRAAPRVQQHFSEAIGPRRDIDVYICGLHQMVDEVRAQLRSMGFDRKKTIYEKYD